MYNTLIISIEDFYREYNEYLFSDIVTTLNPVTNLDKDDVYEWLVLNTINNYFNFYYRCDVSVVLPLNYDYENIYRFLGSRLEVCIRNQLERLNINRRILKIRSLVAGPTIIISVKTQ